MSTTKAVIRPGDRPTAEMLGEINEAAKKTIQFDEDSPRFTKEEMRIMADKARARKTADKKPVVALRVSPKTLELAKATGKGYTGFMSRLLDLAINDLEMVNKALEG